IHCLSGSPSPARGAGTCRREVNLIELAPNGYLKSTELGRPASGATGKDLLMAEAGKAPTLIDGLQFCNWSREVFLQMREGGLTAVHATVAYHEGFRETARHLADWNTRFRDHADLILRGRTADDLAAAEASGRTAIFFGLQNPMPIEDDLGLVE